MLETEKFQDLLSITREPGEVGPSSVPSLKASHTNMESDFSLTVSLFKLSTDWVEENNLFYSRH